MSACRLRTDPQQALFLSLSSDNGGAAHLRVQTARVCVRRRTVMAGRSLRRQNEEESEEENSSPIIASPLKIAMMKLLSTLGVQDFF
jgi:hypothetical protein